MRWRAFVQLIARRSDILSVQRSRGGAIFASLSDFCRDSDIDDVCGAKCEKGFMDYRASVRTVVACWVAWGMAVLAYPQGTGTITGRVVDSATGQPVVDVYVSESAHIFSVLTNANGEFALTGLLPATYVLTVLDPTGAYPTQRWGSDCVAISCDDQEGTQITVAAGQNAAVEIAADREGRIDFVIRDAITQAAVNACFYVELYTALGERVLDVRRNCSTIGVGTFAKLRPGDYYLLFPYSSFLPYAPEISDGRHCSLTCAISGGVPLHVSAGAVATSVIDLDRAGTIRGSFVDATSGQPIYSSASPMAIDVDGGQVVTGTVDSSTGTYQLPNLPPGRYVVGAHAESPFVKTLYPSVPAPCAFTATSCPGLIRQATAITVAPGGIVEGIDIRIIRGATLSGVLSVDGTRSGTVLVSVMTPGGVAVASSFATAPGGYSISQIPPGAHYVCASATGSFVTQAYGGPRFGFPTCPPASGTPIDASAGAQISDISMLLMPIGDTNASSSIAGTIRSAVGDPVRASLALYDDTKQVGSEYAASDGTYTIRFLRAGTYYLRTTISDGTNLVDSWYGGLCVGCGPGRGVPVAVATGEQRTGIDFVLQPGGQITGGYGGPVTEIAAYTVTGEVARTARLSNGTYVIAGLPAGEFYVVARGSHAAGDAYLDVIYPDAPCKVPGCIPVEGTKVPVVFGQITGGIDVTLKRGGRIRGSIVLETGLLRLWIGPPVPKVTVQAFDEAGAPAGQALQAVDVPFEINGLAEGMYFVRTVGAEALGYSDQSFYGIDCGACPVTQATPVRVVAGGVTTNVDFVLHRGGSISGRVTDAATSKPLDNITVAALDRTGMATAAVATARDGSYVIAGLAPGSYLIETRNVGPYVDRRYTIPGCPACDAQAGNPVGVAANSTTSGIDIALTPGGRIIGRVTAAGLSVPSAPVKVESLAGATLASTTTDTNGSYLVTVPPSTVFISTRPARFVAQMYSNVPCAGGSCDTRLANPVLVQPGQFASAIDFSLTECTAPAITVGIVGAVPKTVGSAYNWPLQTSGSGSHRFTLLSGTLPQGLVLDEASGWLRGVLTSAGTYTFTVSATNIAGCSSIHDLTMTVNDCQVSVAPGTLSFGPLGGQATIAVNGACDWPASSSVPWLSVTNIVHGPAGSVSVSAAGNTNATRQGFIAIGNKVIPVAQAAFTTAPPFGSVDLPVDGRTVTGSVALGGWALDDVEVTRVRIWRDPVAPEPSGQYIYIGDAVRVRGARPDVEATYPQMPQRDRAGWGYLLLTNMLPNGGNGTYRLHVWAEDFEGHQTLLGSRTIIAANATATRPFGAIDTPGQGETIWGSSYVNFGWALTPQPKFIPFDGSTITVFVDGLPVGHVDYNHYRVDVSTLFAGLANSGGPVGYRFLDTTALADGVHTISWGVIDSEGSAEGLGSRFFTVDNLGHMSSSTAALSQTEESVSFDRTLLPASTDGGEPRRVLRVHEMERIQFNAVDSAGAGCAISARAFEVVAGERRTIPVGATFDETTGAFTWQPGPGFIGAYNLVFEVTSCDGRELLVPLHVNIITSR